MRNIGTSKQKNENGFEQTITRYESENCTGCPMRGRCHKGQGNRIIEVNHRLNRYKRKARKNLNVKKAFIIGKPGG